MKSHLIMGCILGALVSCTFSVTAVAQSQLTIGSVIESAITSCPGSTWYTYIDPQHGMHQVNCHAGSVTNCAGTQGLGFTFGYLNPLGLVPGVTRTNGLIVFFGHGDGTSPDNLATADATSSTGMVDRYFKDGFEIVQVAWNSAWEQTQTIYSSGQYGNFKYAACRPATLLHYLYTLLYPAIQNQFSQAGMCAQGASAGSAAIAYSLAYYGAGSYLDAVELLSGPVLSDVKEGCRYPYASNLTVCGQNDVQGHQIGCQLGTDGTWMLSPQYLSQKFQIQSWDHDTACAGSVNTCQSGHFCNDALWKSESIIDDGSNVSTFAYPSTNMGAWLCRSVYNPLHIDCTTGYVEQYCPNNSSPEGQYFYGRITQGGVTPPAAYNIYAVDQCAGPENVTGVNTQVEFFGLGGADSLEIDMATNNCKARQH